MTQFSELKTLLTLDNKQFIAGLGRAETAVKGFSTTGATALKGVSLLAGGGLITGIGALGLAIKSTADKFDDLGDAADNLGIGADKLQELSAAADRFGSSGEQLTALLFKMQKTIGDAANGSDKAASSLHRLGLNVQDLIGLTPDQQFKKIANAISAVGDKSLQSSDATSIFGKQASKSLTLLTSNLDEATQKAQEFGQVVSKENVESLSQLSDRLKEVGRSFSTTFGALLATAKPVLDLLLDRLNDILNTVSKIASVGKNLGGFIKETAGIGTYDPNAYTPTRPPSSLRTGIPNSAIAGAGFANRQVMAGKWAANTLLPSDKESFDRIVDNLKKNNEILANTFDKLSSSVEKARSVFENFTDRMEKLQDLRNNRFDDFKGRPQLQSREFDDIARDLIDKQLKGNLTSEFARSQLNQLKGITEDNLQFNQNGDLSEFSTANLKSDLKQLQDLILGNKGKNEIEITVNSSSEFDAKIVKISENSFTSILANEAIGVNR